MNNKERNANAAVIIRQHFCLGDYKILCIDNLTESCYTVWK